MQIIIEWLMEYGPSALAWYAIYVLVGACSFGAYLWYRIWHHEHDPRFKAHDIGHHRAD